jgi:VWFA-related protein
MLYRVCLASLFSLWPLLGSPGAHAQTATVADFQSTPMAVTNANPEAHAVPASDPEGLIKLNVIVSDEHGRPVGGIQSKDFRLLDNGHPSTVLSFRQFGGLAPVPQVQIILVIDEVRLNAGLVYSERIAVEAFLRQNGGHLTQPVSVFSLVETGLWLLGKSSRDGNALAAQVAHNHEATLVRANQSLTESPVLEALKALGQIAVAERPEAGRKLMLWVGPGWGLGTGTYVEGAGSREETFYLIRWFSTLLREAGIALYSFSVGGDGPLSQLYLDYLNGAHKASFLGVYRKVLAVQSGGRVLGQDNDLLSQINSCVQEASVYYTISFDPSHAEHPDEYHTLQVQVGDPRLTARTNTGYYDQPYYSDPPDPEVRRVTIEQLQKVLETLQGNRDGEMARQLSGFELSERLGGTKLASLTAAVHGDRARRALAALADASAFLDSPPAETSTDAPPGETAQRLMISRAADYLQKTIPKLPNFLATRTTVNYQETPEFAEGKTRIDYEPLHVASRSKETVLYRNGLEVADSGSAKRKKRQETDPYLITYGTFGPVLGFVHDAITMPGALIWSHWEKGEAGPDAVFHYRIPADRSLYQVQGCCLPGGDGTRGFANHPAYHGEIAINPATGAIVRLMAIAELDRFTPVDRSDIAVEYGPVQIGGKSYICPLSSVSNMRSRSVVTLSEWDESFRTYGPYATLLNDIAYEDYHLFRGESRVLPGFTPASDDSNQPARQNH